ncbi:MAG: DUF1573 domain-containing protein [Negativicutes bacterium]|nr:DUF1573 domain-containing protein [Negativicutes bacterium]
MAERCLDRFQAVVDECLLRHRSILDIMTKQAEAAARINRAVAKTVTECGCLKIEAGRQSYPPDADYGRLREFVASHVAGEMCDPCREVLYREIGHGLFYLAALANVLGVDLEEVLAREHKTVVALGKFNLT